MRRFISQGMIAALILGGLAACASLGVGARVASVPPPLLEIENATSTPVLLYLVNGNGESWLFGGAVPHGRKRVEVPSCFIREGRVRIAVQALGAPAPTELSAEIEVTPGQLTRQQVVALPRRRGSP